MGYELHITRKNDYEDYEEESNISLEDWYNYIESDTELRLAEDEITPGQKGFCLWNGHSKYKEDCPWFDYWQGTISTKSPDDEVVKKMLQIAGSLRARVMGDDGEFYFEDELEGIIVEMGEVRAQSSPASFEKKPWWKFW